jgi:general secretion pathway protein C
VPVAAVAPSASSRFSLKGVVADTSNGGAALISVDGKLARPFQVGDLVDGRLVVQSVTGRKASLAAGTQAPVEVVLELPPLPQ